MQQPPLHLLRAFTCVVDHHSFARAAQALRMTPSSVSRLVKALEQELGTQLLNRSTRAMSLTAAGQALYAECGSAFAQLRGAYETASHQYAEPSQPRGQLRLSVPVSFGRTHVVPHVAAFLRRYPGIELDLMMTDRYVDLVAEGVGLAIRIGRLDDSALVARKLMDNRRLLVAAPRYLEQHGAPADVAGLSRHACLNLAVNRDAELWRLTGPDGERSLRPQGRIRADNGDAIRQFAIDGLGIAFLSSATVAAALRNGELLQVLPQWSGRPTGVYGVCPQRPVPPPARAAMDFLAGRWP
ncbi:transcriptional regulator [Massilia sp. Root351]|uniref:LysR family transcriptional regulator n=1 Tax=Massilia sp. Root351 TaxID=1736522 RepID=UPI00070FD6C9|nr:LysR family transcriptional regulator [Massilia sp. Root351]KQV79501.1 transcriptional regulator [Massilia sp. Root351]